MKAPKHKSSRRRLPRRWPMLRLSDALAAGMPTPKKRSDVVVLRMFGIGDALLFRAVLEKYAEALNVPLSHITVLGATAWTAALPFFRDVEVKLIDERRFARNFLYRLRVMRDLRRRGFKTAICGMGLRYPHVTESLMLASGAIERIVVEARPNEKFDAMFAHYRPRMTRVVALPEPEHPRDRAGEPLPLMHEIDHQLAFLSAVAGRPITLKAPPKLTPPPGAPPLVGAGERYAVLNIGASVVGKRWPLAHYFDIAKRLMEQGYSVVFLGGPEETDLKHDVNAFIAQQTSRAGPARALTAVGDLDFAAATRLIAGAALVVSSDTGIGHLAIMLQRPSVLIVGGGHFGSFMPYPQSLTPPRVRFLHHPMPCYHCNWNCTVIQPGETTFPCLKQVAPEQVWQAVTDITAAG